MRFHLSNTTKSTGYKIATALLVVFLVVPTLAIAAPARSEKNSATFQPAQPNTQYAVGIEDDAALQATTSHRLIVELESAPLAVWAKQNNVARTAAGRLNVQSSTAQSYVAQLEAQQAAAISAMQAALPGAFVSSYINEAGLAVEETYQIVFNGFTVDPGSHTKEAARRALMQIPGVKAVYNDYKHQPDLYASLPLINAAAAWDNTAIGGQANAGAGIKVASMDGGAHHDAPMFDGTGFSYPPDFPAGGLGDAANNNGKIIASRAYFRSYDPPAVGDENTWPGENGTSHGTHTASTAAGSPVIADYAGITETISGVAPAAWVMSYRVFYASVLGDGSFHSAEGIAALEDIVLDGADVLNNSWGGGPGSPGGEFDPIDNALLNTASAGIFISMSAGNAGPSHGTTDHPSDEYINVAASTTDGTYASGRLSVSAPEPVTTTLQNMAFTNAAFGSVLTVGQVFTFSFVSAEVISPTNYDGCDPWPAGTFTGKAALISRGGCEFGTKVLNAENGGAEFVVIHNHVTGGDDLLTMAPGADGGSVTIPSVFIGYTNGTGMRDWYVTYGAASEVTYDALAFQVGNVPDRIISFSSRGPGAGNVLKPDIAAPGVNILAQGYTPGATGEDRHLGFGQVSGTSMAAPHVTGAAALLRQIHPDWSNAYIKSALMSTSRYTDVYNYDGTPAQPLDMGAGRLDLTHAADPGVILSPPSLSFGLVPTGTVEAITVTVTSVAGVTETYDLGLLMKDSTYPTGTAMLPGFSVSPVSITLAAGESGAFVVTFDPADAGAFGDHQGYVTLDGAMYDGHMPAWAQVAAAAKIADVLIIDNDFSYLLGFPDYTWYYTSTLETLGFTYEVWDADTYFANPQTIPDIGILTAYDAVLYFTGDNYLPDGTFTVATPLTDQDMYNLNAFAQNGGILIAMGQDLAAVWNSDAFDDGHFTYAFTLGGNWLADSVSDYDIATLVVTDTGELPMAGIVLDLTDNPNGDGAQNQYYVDEITALIEDENDPTAADINYVSVLHHLDPTNVEAGVVARVHREQPTLEKPGVAYVGKSLYTTFGLEGVNNPNPGSLVPASTREEFLQRAFDWAMDEPQVSVVGAGSADATFTATLTSNISGVTGVSYRWDFGDGSPYQVTSSNVVTHTYQSGDSIGFTVRVEALDSLGNRTIGVRVGHSVYLPIVAKNAP